MMQGSAATGGHASFFMPVGAFAQFSQEAGRNAVQSLAEHIGDFTRRALSIQDACLSVSEYFSGQDMNGYGKAMAEMENKVRDLSKEALVRASSVNKLVRHLREIKGSLLNYGTYIRTIGEVCRKLSLGRDEERSGGQEETSYLDLAARDIFDIEKSVCDIMQVLDKLISILDTQGQGIARMVEGLGTALDLALQQTGKNREELSSRLAGSRESFREFHGGWSELTAWMASIRKSLLSSREPAREDAIPAEPEMALRPITGTDVFGFAGLVRFMGEHCSGMRESTGGRYAKARSSSQAMKKALRLLTASVERYLATDCDTFNSLKAASEVAAIIFKTLLLIENSALKAELLVLNACIHAGAPRGYTVLSGAMRRLSSITASHTRFVGGQLAKATAEMDPKGTGNPQAGQKIHFAPAFAGVLEIDRDSWGLMDSVLAEAESLCIDMSACIECVGMRPEDAKGMTAGKNLAKGSSQ
jgi:hypothetical protein